MIAMVIAVIVLVATLLAVIALVRSVDTGNLVAGNMAFRQGAVQEAERAYVAIQANVPFGGLASESDNTAVGYYAEIQPTSTRADVPTVLTSSTPTQCNGISMPALSSANVVCYVVERMCANSGPALPPGNLCLVPGATILGGSTSDQTSDRGLGLTGGLVAYRLTVRVDGPKNTLGYVQTTVR